MTGDERAAADPVSALVMFGDWHAQADWAVEVMGNVAAVTPARHWYHLGDFGLWSVKPGSRHRAYLDRVQEALVAHDATLRVVLGNHENYDLVARLARDTQGWGTLEPWDRIRYAPRAHVWTHPGADVLIAALGGAGSIDLRQRTMGSSWWLAEEITDADVDALRALLPPDGVHVFLSHEAPASVTIYDGAEVNGFADPEVVAYCARQRHRLQHAFEAAAPRWAFHGHWHTFHAKNVHSVRDDGSTFDTSVIGLDRDGQAGNAFVLEADLDTFAVLPPIAGFGSAAVDQHGPPASIEDR